MFESYWEENGRSPAGEDGEYTYRDGFDEEDQDQENDDDASGTDCSKGNVGDK